MLKWQKHCVYKHCDNTLFISTILIKKYHIEKLLNSADSKGLKYNCISYINSWIHNTSKLLSGKDYTDAFKLKHCTIVHQI